MSNLHVIDHPLITHKLSIMRNRKTGSKDFRELLNENLFSEILLNNILGGIAFYDVCGDKVEPVQVNEQYYRVTGTTPEAPITKMKAKMVSGRKLAIVPILRAGLGMVDGLQNLVPVAKVGHIGMYRDPETHKPVEYYCKLPTDIEERLVVLVDPMLATGGSAVDALCKLKEHGCRNIRFMCLVAAPEGVKAVQEAHPDVDIYTAALDECLNEHAYIVPGLGDAGDRIFGTL